MALFTFMNEFKYSNEELNLINELSEVRSEENLQERFAGLDVKRLMTNIKISKYKHKFRNKGQYHLCPETLEQMEMLEELKLFKFWGNTPTHNLTPEEDKTTQGRWKAFLSDPHGENFDYRGIKGTIFEGFHIIYHSKTKKLVTDIINKGSYDFVSPERNPLSHFEFDVKPWLAWGQLIADNPKDLIMDNKVFKQIEYIHTLGIKMKLSFDECQLRIKDVITGSLKIKLEPR